MRPIISPALVLALSSLMSIAQSADKPRMTVIVLPPVTFSCPVSLRAQQVANETTLWANDSHQHVVAQRLHLIVTSSGARRITGASITVRGLTNKSRVIQTLSNQDSSDAVETLGVSFTVGADKDVSADVRIPGFTAVSSIEVNSVTYADGSTWKLAFDSMCRSSIDGMMPISNR